jgi:hypothetical protein
MAKNEKGKLYYEIVDDKPFDSFQILLIGGSVGAVLAFLITSIVCTYNAISMDVLLFNFFVASFFGFLIGVLLTLIFVKNFSNFIVASSLMNLDHAESTEAIRVDHADVSKENLVDDESKGQSVDFVFPELSPDK